MQMCDFFVYKGTDGTINPRTYSHFCHLHPYGGGAAAPTAPGTLLMQSCARKAGCSSLQELVDDTNLLYELSSSVNLSVQVKNLFYASHGQFGRSYCFWSRCLVHNRVWSSDMSFIPNDEKNCFDLCTIQLYLDHEDHIDVIYPCNTRVWRQLAKITDGRKQNFPKCLGLIFSLFQLIRTRC